MLFRNQRIIVDTILEDSDDSALFWISPVEIMIDPEKVRILRILMNTITLDSDDSQQHPTPMIAYTR